MNSPTRKKRLPDRDYLIAKLAELSNGIDEKILNSRIYESLGWDRKKFLNVRDKLCSNNILTYEGHYTKFVDFLKFGKPQPAHTLFISYAHQDEDDKDELLKHLTPLARANMIETWHDRKMKPGDKIDKEISENLLKCNVILLMISADFLNSEYCYSIEMMQAIERDHSGTAIVIPILLRHCYWQEAPFRSLLFATKDAKPVSDYRTKDEAFTEIVKGVASRLAN